MKKDIIATAKREIAEENKHEKVTEAKNIIRQIEILKAQLAELNKQISEL